MKIALSLPLLLASTVGAFQTPSVPPTRSSAGVRNGGIGWWESTGGAAPSPAPALGAAASGGSDDQELAQALKELTQAVEAAEAQAASKSAELAVAEAKAKKSEAQAQELAQAVKDLTSVVEAAEANKDKSAEAPAAATTASSGGLDDKEEELVRTLKELTEAVEKAEAEAASAKALRELTRAVEKAEADKSKAAAPKIRPAHGAMYHMDKDLTNAFQANRDWIAEKKAADPKFFDVMGAVHRPPYMWVGCADARVPSNEVIGEDAGQVFTVRNVANMVVNTDFNLMSALQYAVMVLKVKHIIVCGHYDCGGVRASMKNVDHQPPLEDWLRNLRDIYRTHQKELDAVADPEARHRRLVELNVVEQCLNLAKTAPVQQRRAQTKIEIEDGESDVDFRTPRIHGVVFDPSTGQLNKLDVDFDAYSAKYGSIYELYEGAR